MMAAADVEAYLHERIPLSQHMQVRVAACDDEGVRLTAPLGPNVNHRGTVFGGSASALAMLAGWALVHARIADLPFDTRLVIRRNTMEYDRPIDGDVEAWCAGPGEYTLSQFDAALSDRGKARIELGVDVRTGGRSVGSFRGVYVALRA